jgi:hypothetical protein
LHSGNQQNGPVHAAIDAFLGDKVQQFETRLRELETHLADGRANELVTELFSSVIELKRAADELGSWLGAPFHALPSERQDDIINRASKILLSENCLAPAELVRVVELAKQKPRGRPAELRPVAFTAFETKLLHSEQSWRQIISELCRTRRCGNTSHENCFKNIMREVGRLRSCLRRYDILPGVNSQTCLNTPPK